MKILSLLFALFLFFGCSEKEEPQLRIAIVDWIGYAPLYVADYNDYLPKNVRLVFFPSNYDIIKALHFIDIEAAALTLDEVLYHEELPKLSITFLIDYSNGADAILSKAKEPFYNKTIAYEPKSVQEYLLHRALQEHNLTFGDIRPYPLKYHMVLHYTDHIDTVVAFEPIKSKLQQQGFHVVFDSSKIPMEIVDLFVVQAKYRSFFASTLPKLYEAYLKGVEYMRHYPNKAAQIVARYLHTEPQAVQKMLENIIIGDNEENCRFVTQFPNIIKKFKQYRPIQQLPQLNPLAKCKQ